MGTKHTPGPWAVQDIKSDGTMVYRRICVGNTSVGSVGAYKLPKGREAEAEANARLIAAAPELLEAFKRARSFLERGGSGAPFAAANALSAAIAKAEGN